MLTYLNFFANIVHKFAQMYPRDPVDVTDNAKIGDLFTTNKTFLVLTMMLYKTGWNLLFNTTGW